MLTTTRWTPLILYPLLLLQILSSQATDDTPSWHHYVRAPPSRIVRPKRLVSTAGDVSNADGMVLGSGGGPTVLTRSSASDDEVPPPTVVVDFGQNVVGLLVLDFVGAAAAGDNTSQGFPGLRVVFSETLAFLGDVSDFTRSDHASGDQKLVAGSDQIAVKPDPYTWTNQWGCESNTQVCADGLHAFRYVKLTMDALPSDAPHTTSHGFINISSISLVYSGFLGTPDTFKGWFECSDANLTQWWYDGAYTTDMCTDEFRANDTEARDADSASLLGRLVLHDGAKRDRDPYLGDLAVAGLASYLTHDVHEAARNVLEDLAGRQRDDGWIPPASINNYTLALFDYPLWWVSCSWDHVFYTGNVSYIESYYSTLLSVLDEYYVAHTDSVTSLLVRPDGYGDFAFTNRPGAAAYYSALYVLALKRAADLADLLSKPTDASRWRQRADTVSQSFQQEFWDPNVGAFLDRRCSEPGCDAHAQDGNSLAILSGIAASNSSRARSALTYLADALRRDYGNAFYDAAGESLGAGYSDRVYAFVSYFEMAARFETGLVGSALELIRRTYGWMADGDPGVTAWEGVGAGGVPYEGGFTSMAHAWSTGVVPLMVNYVLGVRPTSPGFAAWSVRPLGGDLEWARGEVSTPAGPIRVWWERRGGGDGDLFIWVEAPAGTLGAVSIPVGDGGDRVVSVNGVVVWDGRGVAEMGAVLGEGFVRVDVEGGGEVAVDYVASTAVKVR